jgi:hypothetical protein
MSIIDDLVRDLAALSPDDRALVREHIDFLRWRAGRRSPLAAEAGRPWTWNLLEHFAEVEVRATRDQAGMEVKAAEASVGGERRPALWQHPPVSGEAVVDIVVPIPVGLRDLRLRAAVGIRDGSSGPAERLVAFRIRVGGWQVWSRAAWPRQWESLEVGLPFQAGDVLRVSLATDGLGDHEWAWAVWGEPVLVGTEAGAGTDGGRTGA